MNKKYKITYLASFIIVLLSVGLSLTSIIINHLPKEAPTPVEPTPTPDPTPTPSVKEDIDISGVIFENKEYTYDGNVKKLEAKNVPDTLDYDIKYYINNEEISDAINHGEYKAKLIFKVKNEDLYNKPNDLEANLIINKQVIDINDLAITNEFIFNKEEQKIAISNLPTGITYTESYYDKYNNLVNPFNSGIYKAKINFIINNDNYDIDSEYELILNIYNNLRYKEEEDSASVLGFVSGYEENYINIPSTYNNLAITTINDVAFYDSNIYEATLGNNIENIKNSAFSNSYNLMSLTLGNNIKNISNTAFDNCYRLKEVINLSDIALSDTSNIKKYAKDIYDSLLFESKLIYSDNSFVYYLENDELALINYLGEEKALTIDSSYDSKTITKIEDYALYDLDLTALVINSGFITLGKYSLANNNIKTLVLPNTLTKIENYALSENELLTTITLQDSLNELGIGVFKNCISLTTLINFNNLSLTSISDYLFSGCSSIEEINLPSSVKEIGRNAFEGTTKLLSLDISNITTINEYSFASSGLSSITIPSILEEIPSYAFYNANLTTITIPDNISLIGDYAFTGNANLENVILNDGLIEIGAYAFSGLSKLKAITLPNTLTDLGERAFIGCSSLEEINLSTALTKIPLYAFEGVKIANITIPSSVTVIESGAFYECRSLTTIVIPETVQEMGANIFDGCTSLLNVTINAQVNRIGTNVFNDCSNLGYVITAKTIKTFVENSINNENTLIYSYAESITIEANNSITATNVFYYSDDLDSETEAGQYWTLKNGNIETKII